MLYSWDDVSTVHVKELFHLGHLPSYSFTISSKSNFFSDVPRCSPDVAPPAGGYLRHFTAHPVTLDYYTALHDYTATAAAIFTAVASTLVLVGAVGCEL